MRALILCTAILATAAATQTTVQPPVLTLTRAIKIDGVAEDLVRVGWVRVGADGRIAFSQVQDRLIRFYDATGKAIGKFGRAGDGPGEFRSLSNAGWFGDSLWVLDGNSARLTIIPPSLGEPRTIETRLRAGIRGSSSNLPRLVGTRVDGISRSRDFLASGMPFADSSGPPLPAFSRDLQTAYVRATQDGSYQSFIAGVPIVPNRLVSVGTTTAAVPFVARILSGAAHDASRVVVASASIEGRDAGTFSVTSIGIRGDTVFTRRYPFTLERIPGAAAQKAVDDQVESLRRMGNANAAQFRTLARVPAVYPPLALMVVGRDGSVWIAQRTTSAGRPYLVLDPRGIPYGQFSLKEDISIMEADLNNIWTVEPDADGVQSVVRYRIAR